MPSSVYQPPQGDDKDNDSSKGYEHFRKMYSIKIQSWNVKYVPQRVINGVREDANMYTARKHVGKNIGTTGTNMNAQDWMNWV